MFTLNESLTRTETPLATGEAALPVTAPVERVEKSSAVTQVAATSTPARKHSGFGIASFVRALLLGLGIPALLIVVCGGAGFFALLQRGVAEVREMGPWPSPDVPPEALVTVDLSHLGLEVGQTKNARDEESWAGGHYDEGVLIMYGSGAKTVVGVWTLRYGDKRTAGNDFSSVRASAGEPGNCGLSTYVYFGNSGVI